jgi:hypothetical protein
MELPEYRYNIVISVFKLGSTTLNARQSEDSHRTFKT